MTTRTSRILLPGIGAGIGLTVAALAVYLGGGGHGWTSALVSASAVLLAPAAGVALTVCGSRAGFRLAIVLAALALTADVELVRSTLDEGTSYLREVWVRAPGLVSLWACLWLAWQLALIQPLVQRPRARATD